MSNETTHTTLSPLTTIILLGAVLGPLAALAFGSKYADEETLQRARAGLVNAKPTDLYANYDAMRAPGAASSKTITELTEGSGIFSDLRAAIKTAGAEAMLSGQQPYTVFAPSDEAFARMPAAQLSALLTSKDASNQFINSHVMLGRVTETELMQKGRIATLSGEKFNVSAKGALKVGTANVSKSIPAENGMIHVIDRVLL